MLVDNAVVVLENIYRRHALGESPFQAAVRGTQEVWGAVVASTLTTVAVFLPVVFMQEEAGQLFRDIALAISGAVALSLVVSMTVIPTAAARLFDDTQHTNTPTPRRKAVWLATAIQRCGELFVAAVVAFNQWGQRGIFRRIVLVIGLSTAAVAVSVWLWPRVEYLPSGNRNLVFGILLPPPGYNLDQLMGMGETIEQGLLPFMDVDPDSTEAQQLPFPVIDDFFFVARGRSVFMGLRAVRCQPSRRAGASYPETGALSCLARSPSPNSRVLFEQGLTAGRTIEVEITGPELSKLVGLGRASVGQNPRDSAEGSGSTCTSLDLSTPELHVTPKLVQAAAMKWASSADLGFTVNALVDGAYVGDYYYRGKKIDMTLMGNEQFVHATQDIAALPDCPRCWERLFRSPPWLMCNLRVAQNRSTIANV